MATHKSAPLPAANETAQTPLLDEVRTSAQAMLAEGRHQAFEFLLAALAAVLKKSRQLELLWPNANADVEAVHRLIEEEVFDLERYEDLEEFMRKATLYQHYFNFAHAKATRATRRRGTSSAPTNPPSAARSWRCPVLLEHERRTTLQVGQDVPGLDARGSRGSQQLRKHVTGG